MPLKAAKKGGDFAAAPQRKNLIVLAFEGKYFLFEGGFGNVVIIFLFWLSKIFRGFYFSQITVK